jgi:hypothetical protein
MPSLRHLLLISLLRVSKNPLITWAKVAPRILHNNDCTVTDPWQEIAALFSLEQRFVPRDDHISSAWKNQNWNLQEEGNCHVQSVLLDLAAMLRIRSALCVGRGSQSQSHIMIDNESASPSWCQAPIWDPRPIFLSHWDFVWDSCGLLCCSTLSDERTGL